MPGPQGPETVKAINPETGEEYDKLVTSKADTPATEIGPKEPPKTSLVDNSSTNSNTTRASNTANSGQRTSADPRRVDAPTTTTSNQAPRVVGFRYYRDLGQN